MIQASIIIPAYNDAEHLQQTLQAIGKQDYPKEKTEVFVIDNGSTDNTREVAKGFPLVELLKEEHYLGSPYSARNRGIEAAREEVIVLLDATCVPVEDWLSNGLACLEQENADIVAGNVRLDVDEESTLSEIYDAITNLQMEETVKKRGVAKTANLFIRKKVFDEVGLFPEGVRSGADVRWTKKATREGCKLVFGREAISYKPARKFKGLVKKQWRVAKGQPAIWMENGKKINTAYLVLVLGAIALLFPFFNNFNQKIQKSEFNVSLSKQVKLNFLHYVISLIMKSGNIYGYLIYK